MGADHNSNNGSNDIIETYIQRLLAWKEPLTVAMLQSLAEDAGLGDAEIAAVQEKAQAHFKRGKNYLNFDCLDDAIEEFTQATALSPLDTDILHHLSQSYAQRYQLRQSIHDKDNCITTAKRCLEIDPEDAQAVTLIKSLDTQPNVAKAFRNRLMLGVLIGILPIFVLSYFFIFNNRLNLTNKPQKSGQTFATQVAAEVDIPIEFDHPGLALQTQLSRLNNYPKKSFYTFNGTFLNQSDQEIDSVVLNVTYLDAAGNEIDTDSEDAVEDHTPPLRPGDSHAMHLLQELNPTLSKVHLSVATIDQLPAAAIYLPETPIDYEWAIAQPTHLNFELASRSENVSTSYATHFDGHWVITNQGDSAIRELQLKVDFYDRQNTLTSTKETYVVITSYAPIMPEERRPIRMFEEVSEEYDRYTVTVISAE